MKAKQKNILAHCRLSALASFCLSAWAVSAGAAGLPAGDASAASKVQVTEMTSFHYTGASETGTEGAKGWPSVKDPSSPPLFLKHPLSQRPFLFGGSFGQALRAIGSVGLWWMQASPGHYERLEVDENRVYGLIPGTPVRTSDGSIMGVIVSMFAEQYDASTTTETAQYSLAVRKGAVFRTEFDGTHLVPISSTQGKLNMPNGALVVDAQDNLYGADMGEQGHGRIFKVDANDKFSTLYEFQAGPNGMRQVLNDIILGSDGWIYGVTGYDRGLPNAPTTPTEQDTPTGTLFKLDPSNPAGSFRVLHTFRLKEGEINVQSHSGNERLRYYPSGDQYVPGTAGDVTISTNGVQAMVGLSSLVEGKDGHIYGTTSINRCQVYAKWKAILTAYTTVSADSPLCGYRYPGKNVLPAESFPHYDGQVAHGAVYRIPMDASDEDGRFQILHEFSGDDGSTPRGPLALGKDGNIYGTTLSGGSNRLWSFAAGLLDHAPTCEDLGVEIDRAKCRAVGAEEFAAGTGYKTVAWADQGLTNGTLFRIVTSALAPDANGKATASGFQSLHSFKYDVDGFRPLGVRAGEDGRLYGVTSRGGSAYTNNRGEQKDYDDNGAVFVVDLDGDLPSASITLTVSPQEIASGASATLTWTSWQTRDCLASSSQGDWTGPQETSGSLELTPGNGTLYYTLQCTDSVKGTAVSAVVPLYVNSPIIGKDGNKNEFGNGGGSLPAGVLLLLAIAGLARRRP
jgi:hypothetical protein